MQSIDEPTREVESSLIANTQDGAIMVTPVASGLATPPPPKSATTPSTAPPPTTPCVKEAKSTSDLPTDADLLHMRLHNGCVCGHSDFPLYLSVLQYLNICLSEVYDFHIHFNICLI